MEIEHDAALAAIPRPVRGRVEAGTAGWLDADHVGALVGEQHAREWTGDVLSEIDDAHAIQCRCHAVTPRRRSRCRPGAYAARVPGLRLDTTTPPVGGVFSAKW